MTFDPTIANDIPKAVALDTVELSSKIVEPSAPALAARMHSFSWAANEGRRAWTRKLRASVKAVQGWR